jgi:RimJ/RimL family protein N-acetyltransferase
MTTPIRNALGQPIGAPLPNWQPPPRPPRTAMAGRFCRVEPLDPDRHVADLYAANSLDQDGRNWTYLPIGPFPTSDAYREWLDEASSAVDRLFHAIVDLSTGKAVGVASYLRIDPAAGSIEVGHINYSPLLQRKPAATEAMYLMMRRAFELGYRRYEWKCDSLNAPSRAAAQRFGFSYEGLFRQAIVYKGRTRDTAWYAIIDGEWPALRAAFERWLDPANFDAQGNQCASLSSFTGPLVNQRG